jgi:hypothetical protein
LGSCTGGCPAEGAQTIAAGESKTFTYTYAAHTGGQGGTASFSGYAQGTIDGVVVRSGWSLSGAVQIGGFEGALTGLGAFGLDYFYFKYTGNNHQTETNAGSIDDDEDYVAMYVKVKNVFNSDLKITKYSYLQYVREGSEQNFYIVKQVNTGPNPDTLTAYTMDELDSQSDPNWITITPGSEVVIAFASDNFQSSTWKWSCNHSGCPSGGVPVNGYESDSVLIVIVYLLNGEIYAQNLPFQAVLIKP